MYNPIAKLSIVLFGLVLAGTCFSEDSALVKASKAAKEKREKAKQAKTFTNEDIESFKKNHPEFNSESGSLDSDSIDPDTSTDKAPSSSGSLIGPAMNGYDRCAAARRTLEFLEARLTNLGKGGVPMGNHAPNEWNPKNVANAHPLYGGGGGPMYNVGSPTFQADEKAKLEKQVEAARDSLDEAVLTARKNGEPCSE